MSPATPQMREVARRVLAYEAKERKSSGSKSVAAFFAGEKLQPQLATLLSNVGFRALLSRALALAGEEVPWLRAVQVKADGSLEGFAEGEAKIDPQEAAEGRLVLLAHLLGLLVAFIGEILTLQLVLEAWPGISLNNFKFLAKEKNHEKKP